MFKRSKDKRKDSNTANARLVKKILKKDPGRRIFGFACSPDIPARLKLLASQLHIPLFALCEHCLQLSAEQIAKMAENPEEREILRMHIIGVHVDARTVEKNKRVRSGNGRKARCRTNTTLRDR
jgi:hypothetical protein